MRNARFNYVNGENDCFDVFIGIVYEVNELIIFILAKTSFVIG